MVRFYTTRHPPFAIRHPPLKFWQSLVTFARRFPCPGWSSSFSLFRIPIPFATAAQTDSLKLYLPKLIFGKGKVKFRMLYQALTKVDPLPGKETGTVSSVIRQRQKQLTVSQSWLQLFDYEVINWLHVTFCPFSTFLKPGDKNGQKVPKSDIAGRPNASCPKRAITRLGSVSKVLNPARR